MEISSNIEPTDNTKPKQKRERFGSNKDLRTYIEEFNEDNRITTENLYEKSLMVGAIRAKWLEYYKIEEDNLKVAKSKKEILESKLTNKSISALPMKSRDVSINGDDRIKLLNEIIDNIKTNIDFILRAMDILSNMGYAITTSKDLLKMRG